MAHGRSDTGIVEGRGGLPCVEVSSPRATGRVYLQGGQITSWLPADEPDVLFVSDEAQWAPGAAIRGGIPVCFPWFGARRDSPGAPSHGFARTLPWRLESVAASDDGVTVTMVLESSDESRTLWPADFRLEQRATFGASLVVDLTVTNTGRAPFTFEEALHTYYRVENVDRVCVRGLDGVRYLDALEAFAERTQQGDLRFEAETDRVYVDTPARIAVSDAALDRSVLIATECAANAVVWNPWIAKARVLRDLGDDEWQRFVCVETANVRASAITLAPGKAHTMGMRVTVSRYPHPAPSP